MSQLHISNTTKYEQSRITAWQLARTILTAKERNIALVNDAINLIMIGKKCD